MRAEIVAPAVAALAGLTAPITLVQDDPNVAIDRGDDDAWARFSFQEGEQRFESIGGIGGNLERGALLAYCDLFFPLNTGDGESTEAAEAVKAAWRRLSVTGARWQYFGPAAPEGIVDGQYRRQIVGVFLMTKRV